MPVEAAIAVMPHAEEPKILFIFIYFPLLALFYFKALYAPTYASPFAPPP